MMIPQDARRLHAFNDVLLLQPEHWVHKRRPNELRNYWLRRHEERVSSLHFLAAVLATCDLLRSIIIWREYHRVSAAVNTRAFHQSAFSPIAIILARRRAVGTNDSTCDSPFLAFRTLHDLHHILADATVGVQRLPHRRQRNLLRLHHPSQIPEQLPRPPFT